MVERRLYVVPSCRRGLELIGAIPERLGKMRSELNMRLR